MTYGERTNSDRAEAARVAFEASSHSEQSNEDIVNLYDLVCDLLHLADTLEGLNDESARNGHYVHEMALFHYEAELAEEAEEADDA